MKILRLLQYIIALLLVATLTACGDFLKEESQSEIIPKSVQDLRELLLGNAYPDGTNRLYPFLYLLDDDVECNYNGFTGDSHYRTLESYYAAYTWQPNLFEDANSLVGLTGTKNIYANLYNKIMGCNAVLDQLADIKEDASLANRTRAEALALRSWYYLLLVNVFATPYNEEKTAPGVPLQLTAEINDKGIARNTVEEVYRQIVADLSEAVNLFKQEHIVLTQDYHINQLAALLLLSRAYLYMEDWQHCIEVSNTAISLSNGLEDMTSITTWTPCAVYGFKESVWLYGCAEYTLYACPQNLFFLPSQELLALYDRENDKRYTAWTRTLSTWDFTENGMFRITGVTINKNDYSGGTTRLGNSLRIVEAYLNRAEAYARLGDADKAAADINQIGRNRIVGYQDVAQVSIEDVLKERRRELCFETTRWFDLRRCGRPSITHKWKTNAAADPQTYTLTKGDCMYVLPLPATVVEHNQALEQNPSATSAMRTGI